MGFPVAVIPSLFKGQTRRAKCVSCGEQVPYAETRFYPHATRVGDPVADLRSCKDEEKCVANYRRKYGEPR